MTSPKIIVIIIRGPSQSNRLACNLLATHFSVQQLQMIPTISSGNQQLQSNDPETGVINYPLAYCN